MNTNTPAKGVNIYWLTCPLLCMSHTLNIMVASDAKDPLQMNEEMDKQEQLLETEMCPPGSTFTVE